MFSKYMIPGLKMVTARILLALLIFGCPLWASAKSVADTDSTFENSLALVLLFIMFVLLLAIVLLSHVLSGAMEVYKQKQQKESQANNAITPTLLTILLLIVCPSLFAQNAASNQISKTSLISGIDPIVFYIMVAIIGIEVLVILTLVYQVKALLGIEKIKRIKTTKVTLSNPVKTLWDKMNSFKPSEQEADIDLGHSYDGIRELDNRLPPWWLYGFYLTIIFSGIYLWRYHVSHTAPLPEDEYKIAMKVADEQKQVYLKKAASQVDENTVTVLTATGDLAIGKGIYETNCTPCHGKAGEGVVGPNLTDNYWLHGGGIKDIFKIIKYGVAEKGMRSWKDDFSAVQIAQLSSYIRSIHGTNPPNAKEKQGDLFKEEAAPGTDSSQAKPTQKLAQN